MCGPIGGSVGVVVALLVGCGPPRGPQFVSDPDPAVKIPAIKRVSQDKHKAGWPQLVKDLNDDDPAVRFYAIEALQRVTGDAKGYNYFDDEVARKPALERWKAWLDESGH